VGWRFADYGGSKVKSVKLPENCGVTEQLNASEDKYWLYHTDCVTEAHTYHLEAFGFAIRGKCEDLRKYVTLNKRSPT